ncbi:MAG TPA: 3-hydroxyacyl-CoA dehydrogenase NAD-binding domain-containing protein, partial [Ramlibacter sp.]|nr:3-hydroxyacyl-CoA dehydrogenase NAD-binding domain-containing protein [Ramlibacter sp.]
SDVRHGRLNEAEAAAALRSVRVTPSFGDLDGTTFVIESVPEDLALKQEVLAAIEAHVSPDCVVASNSSSIPLGAIASRARRPQLVIGTHFFWPAHRYRLVEMARTPATSEDTLYRALALVRWLGKVPLLVRDLPGFFTTRVLLVYLNEAVALVNEGASVDAVDGAMQAFGWPMGPFRLLDAVGLTIFRGIHQYVSRCLGDRVADFARLWPVLEAGHVGWGRGHSGGAKGFYRQPAGAEVDERVYSLIGRNGGAGPTQFDIAFRPVWQLLNEIGHCLAEGVVASPHETDLGMLLGLGWPSARGSPISYARGVGVSHIVAQLAAWAERYGPRFVPSPVLCAW